MPGGKDSTTRGGMSLVSTEGAAVVATLMVEIAPVAVVPVAVVPVVVVEAVEEVVVAAVVAPAAAVDVRGGGECE